VIILPEQGFLVSPYFWFHYVFPIVPERTPSFGRVGSSVRGMAAPD
jgi:hypothetical protein